MSDSAEILVHKMSRREFRQRMASGELKACIIPIAAIEQHLEHLAMEHDWRSVTLIAEAAARELAPHVLVAEALMAGVSEHHMKHPGTLTLRAGTFLSVVEDLIDTIHRAGFNNILVLNGHGGNIAPCEGVFDQFVRRFQVNLHFLSYWDLFTQADTDLLESGKKIPTNLPGHAQEFETSVAMARFPENVRSDALRDQPDPSPAMATAAKGEEYLRRVHERLVKYVTEMMHGDRVAEIPPFHP